ncbi:hypothetical protein TNCV_1680731, partial [Trichonephila clavipes]
VEVCLNSTDTQAAPDMENRSWAQNNTSETSGFSLIVAVFSNIFITGSQSETKLASPYFKNLHKYPSPMMFISRGFHPMLTNFEYEKGYSLAKEGCNAPPPISSTLTYSKHQSRVKSEILKERRTPPNPHWYECKHPGPSFLLKYGRATHTSISKLKSGHIKSLSFCGGRDTFTLCTKFKTQQAFPVTSWSAWDLRGRTFCPLTSWYWFS